MAAAPSGVVGSRVSTVAGRGVFSTCVRRRSRMSRSIIRAVACAVVALIVTACETAAHHDRTMKTLFDRWDARDGAEFLEVGAAISDTAIAHPEPFFRAAISRPNSYQSWLEQVSVHSFRDFGSVDRARLERRLSALRGVASRFSRDPRFAGAARQLEDHLTHVEITTVN